MLGKVLSLSHRSWIIAGARENEEALKKELAMIKSQMTAIKENSTKTRRG
jgi:hypothetical protein